MKLEIKDYLHLYLGCDIQYPNTDGKLMIAKMTGFSRADGVETTYKKKRFKKGEAVGDYLSWKANGHHNCNANYIKLVLRPIKNMTEEERKELWRLVFSFGNILGERALDFTGITSFKHESTYYHRPRHIMMQGVERLAIENDGTVWADCDLQKWRYNQHEVTRWLLSKGFDLFNLIDQGLAIKAE